MIHFIFGALGGFASGWILGRRRLALSVIADLTKLQKIVTEMKNLMRKEK